MATVADQFTDSQIDEMKEAFNLFDRNKVKTAKSKTFEESRIIRFN